MPNKALKKDARENRAPSAMQRTAQQRRCATLLPGR